MLIHTLVVISFCRILHPDKPPLDIGTTYWSLRESVIQCELFLARSLQFHFAVDHPHKVGNVWFHPLVCII